VDISKDQARSAVVSVKTSYTVFSPTKSMAVALLEGVSLSELSGIGLAPLAMCQNFASNATKTVQLIA
jgi:hypothetical protein